MLVYDTITIAATDFRPRRTLRRCWARISGTSVLTLVAVEYEGSA